MIDEREAHDVRAWLSTAEVPDLRLDPRDTVRAGRRRARRRRTRQIAAGGVLALAALLAVPAVIGHGGAAPPAAAKRTPPPDGPFSCTYRALPVPSGLGAGTWNLQPNGMDPSGRYVVAQAMGAVDDLDGPRMPVLWDDGVGRLISPDLRGRPTAVSEKGVVAGERMPDGGAWIYRDGKVSDLPVPAGARSVRIVAIDADGDLLGSVFSADPQTLRIAVWKAGTPRYLDVPGTMASPLGFLPGGGVVGWNDTEQVPYVWDADGRATAYTAPAGALESIPVGAGGGYVYAVGKRSVEGAMVPIRWKIGGDGTAEWLGSPEVTPPADGVTLVRVGAAGALLFEVVDEGTGPLDNRFRSVVVRGGHRAQLAAPDGRAAHAFVVNEFGTKIAGTARTPDGTDEPAIWTC